MPSGTIASKLRELISSGFDRIGEISIQTAASPTGFILCHHADAESANEGEASGLKIYWRAQDAREIATFGSDGTYRFTKVQLNLVRGWVMILDNEADLREALDCFYPGCVGLFLAWQAGDLEVEFLRDKLARQTGMYRYTNTISDAGAQKVVQRVCGPDNRCARRILWQIDAKTPLEDSAASRYLGIPDNARNAIPLLCREACNHFVAECRKEAQAEAKAKAANAGT